jgi:hypothetical protein
MITLLGQILQQAVDFAPAHVGDVRGDDRP